jgi:hypothetical protein
MKRERKIGTILILIGVCVPLISLIFVSGYERDKGFIDNLLNIGIPFRTVNTKIDSVPVPDKKNLAPGGKPAYSWDKVIGDRFPFRFILALGVLLIFVGIVRIDRSRRSATKTIDGS